MECEYVVSVLHSGMGGGFYPAGSRKCVLEDIFCIFLEAISVCFLFGLEKCELWEGGGNTSFRTVAASAAAV